VDFTNEGIRGLCHNHCTSFPNQTGRGAAFDRELEYEIARVTALEAKALGYSNVYSPILDVLQDPRWGRARESYGESPYLVGELGLQNVRGLQDQRIVSTPKHYAVYSAPYGGKDMVRGDCQIPLRTVHEVHMEPFRKAFVEGHALGVMSTYAIYDGDSVTGSKYFLTDLLRDTYGFKGYVVSDSGAVNFIHERHHQTDTFKEAVAKAVNAGLNVRTSFVPPSAFLNPLRQAIQDGLVTEATIDSRVHDVLYVKFWMGLFDNPYIGLEDAPQRVHTEEARRLALRAARESIVLLRNRESILPLKPENYKRILVCGPSADDAGLMTMHYGPHRADIVTPLQGIQNAFGETCQVEYSRGCHFIGEQFPRSDILKNYQPSAKELAEIEDTVEKAKQNDLIIACMGDFKDTCQESVSRSALTLPRLQEVFVQKLVETGKPVILVLLNGRPVVLDDAQDGVPAILCAFFGGEAAGTAIADCLTGAYNPGGRLPYTTPQTVGQLPMAIPYRQFSWTTGGRAYVNEPLFPFGYGLSYTTFAYDDLAVQIDGQGADAKISVSFKLKNTGTRTGDAVPQLYIKDITASVSPFEKQLRGFDRVQLQPGEEKQITMVLDAARDLKMMNLQNEWVVEPGLFEVIIAESFSAADTRLSSMFILHDDGQWETISVKPTEGIELEGTVSSEKKNVAGHVLDGNQATRWSTAAKDPALTFRCSRQFNQLGFFWYNGDERTYPFEVLVSDDQNSWTEIYRGVGGNTRFLDLHDLPLVESKFLRIQFHGNSENVFTSIYEIMFSSKTML
jgi:beta-glucosidase